MTQCELIERQGLERSLKVTIPAQDVDQKVDLEIHNYASSASWKGFRKGKLPKNMVATKVGKQIRAKVLNELLEPSLRQAIDGKSLTLAGQPVIELLVDERGKDLEYEAKFEIMPEFDLVDLKTCTVKLPVCALPDLAIQNGMDVVVKQHMNWADCDDAAENGMQLTVDFKGTLNGEVFPGGEAKGHVFVLGEGQMLEAFETPMLGKKAGEVFTFPMTFPKDYHQNTLAGLTVECEVTIQYVKKGTLPKMDADFFKRVEVPEATEEAFRKAVETPLQEELNKQLLSLKKARLYNLLAEQHTLTLPEVLVGQEAQALLEDIKRTQRLDAAPEMTDDIRQQAEKRVTLSLISNRLIEKLDIQVDNKALEAHIKSKAVPYIEEAKFLEWFYSDEQRVQGAARELLETQLVETCYDVLTTKEEQIAYDDLQKKIEEEWNL